MPTNPLTAESTDRTTAARLAAIARKLAPGAVAGILLLGLAGYWLFSYSATLTSADAGANGIVLGVAGLGVSCCGFALTIWQLDRTVNAAAAATTAVQDLKARLSAHDATVEAQRAISYLQETQRHLRIPAWESAITSYSGLRSALIKLQESPDFLGQVDLDELSQMIKEIDGVAQKVERGLLKRNVSVDRGRTLAALNNYEQTLLKLSIVMQRKIA